MAPERVCPRAAITKASWVPERGSTDVRQLNLEASVRWHHARRGGQVSKLPLQPSRAVSGPTPTCSILGSGHKSSRWTDLDRRTGRRTAGGWRLAAGGWRDSVRMLLRCGRVTRVGVAAVLRREPRGMQGASRPVGAAEKRLCLLAASLHAASTVSLLVRSPRLLLIDIGLYEQNLAGVIGGACSLVETPWLRRVLSVVRGESIAIIAVDDAQPTCLVSRCRHAHCCCRRADTLVYASACELVRTYRHRRFQGRGHAGSARLR